MHDFTLKMSSQCSAEFRSSLIKCFLDKWLISSRTSNDKKLTVNKYTVHQKVISRTPTLRGCAVALQDSLGKQCKFGIGWLQKNLVRQLIFGMDLVIYINEQDDTVCTACRLLLNCNNTEVDKVTEKSWKEEITIELQVTISKMKNIQHPKFLHCLHKRYHNHMLSQSASRYLSQWTVWKACTTHKISIRLKESAPSLYIQPRERWKCLGPHKRKWNESEIKKSNTVFF